jgi:Pectate lyase superfamily protein
MAVVQISKIQQRRGQKLLSGMPQLSSAELAWAVDTQELFIGNGSVTEGAPYVGNTRVLTEHDNILELAGSYKFAEPDVSISASIFRSLQSKLDEMEVSVTDFGPQPDPSTNHAPHFVTAFAQLFQNVNTRYRKVLTIPNGHYYFTSTLKIPSNVILRGETQDGVILDIGANAIEFLSATGTDVLGPFTSTDHPTNVSISNLTIQYTTGGMDITGLKDSRFEQVKWKSTYTLGDAVSTPVLAAQSYDLSAIANTGNISIAGTGLTASPLIQVFTSDTVTTVNAIVTALNLDTTFDNNFVASRVAELLVITATTISGLLAADIETYFTITVTPTSILTPFEVDPVPTQASSGINNTNSALSWINSNFGTRTTGIKFVKCEFDSLALALKCIHNHGESDVFDTELAFDDCRFFVCDTGVYVEGVTDRQGHLWTFNDCRFEEIAKQAFFSTFGTGTLIKDSEFKNVGNGVNGAAYPETQMVRFSTKFGNVVENCRSDRHQSAGITLVNTKVGSVSFNNDYYSAIYLSDTFAPLAVFSVFNRYIIIDYTLTVGADNYNRKGQLTIVVQDGVETTSEHVAIADNYTYSSSLITDPGGNMITSFEFNAELKDNDDTTGDSTQSVDTILLSYKNPNSFLGTGTISYNIRYGV